MSTVNNHETVIDDVGYSTVTLPASQGLILLPQLLSMFGEAMVGLFIATDEKQKEKLLEDPKVIGTLVARIAKGAADSEFGGLLILKELLKKTECSDLNIGDAEGVPGSVYKNFDVHFAGKYGHLLRVCMWVAKVNFMQP